MAERQISCAPDSAWLTIFLSGTTQIVKSNILASLTLATVFAFQLSGCGGGKATEPATPAAPRNEIDVTIDRYEDASGDCLRMAKKHTTGDVSVTVLLIVARKTFQNEGVQLQQSAAKMSPAQSQRVAAIAAKTAPCLGP